MKPDEKVPGFESAAPSKGVTCIARTVPEVVAKNSFEAIIFFMTLSLTIQLLQMVSTSLS
jgi:hypothetical protein